MMNKTYSLVYTLHKALSISIFFNQLHNTYDMEKSYHRQVIEVELFAGRCFGLWSHVNDSSTIKKIVYNVYSSIMTSFLWIFMGTLVADLLSNFDDLIVVTDDICFLAGVIPIVFKHVAFLVYRKEIINLMEDIYRPIDNLAKSTDKGVIRLLATTTFYVQLKMYSFWPVAASMIVGLLAIVPSVNGSLPVRAKYPFDTTEGLKHNIAFATQATGLTTGVIAILFMDAVFLCFCLYTIPQVQLLDSNYRHCQLKWPRAGFSSKVEDAKNSNSEISSFVPFCPTEANEANDSFRKRFITCIKHHHRISNIVDDINHVYGSSMFFQLFASCSMICLTGFQLALKTEITVLIKYTIFCTTAFSHQYIWCWVGNALLNQSVLLAESPWCSSWENENYSDLAYLIIVSAQRGQRSMRLKAANFYTMSMDTFLMIIRASYSFFALLSAVTED